MDQNTPPKEAVTLSEMARMCRLSRSRFYGLVREGVFPEPSRNPDTKRPYYTKEQQEQCLLVRRTHCGINGQPILFYAQHASTQAISSRPKKNSARNQNSSERGGETAPDPLIEELKQGLAQLGLTETTEPQIRGVLADAYPDGHQNVPVATLLMTVFRSLNRQDSPDNVAR